MSKSLAKAEVLLTLTECESGHRYRVVEVHGGSALRARLEQMGLNQGWILAKTGGHLFRGPIMVKIQHTELAIGHGMASHIQVEPLP